MTSVPLFCFQPSPRPETFKGWESITHLNLDIFCTTFNAAGKDFSHFVGKKDAGNSSVVNKMLSQWIPRDKSYDMYCFALQVCAGAGVGVRVCVCGCRCKCACMCVRVQVYVCVYAWDVRMSV